jgi:hypothetical protein
VEPQPAAPIFLALQESAIGHVMRSSPALYPTVEILHILGFVVLVGSILVLDLRLLGLGRAIPIQPIAQLLLPLSRFGFLLAISMGFLLFSADAAHVARIPARGGVLRSGVPKRPAPLNSRHSSRFCCGSAPSALGASSRIFNGGRAMWDPRIT